MCLRCKANLENQLFHLSLHGDLREPLAAARQGYIAAHNFTLYKIITQVSLRSVGPQLRVLRVPRLQRPAVHHGVREAQRRLPALEAVGLPLPDPQDPVHQTHQAVRGAGAGGASVGQRLGLKPGGPHPRGPDWNPKPCASDSELWALYRRTATTTQTRSDVAATSLSQLISYFCSHTFCPSEGWIKFSKPWPLRLPLRCILLIMSADKSLGCCLPMMVMKNSSSWLYSRIPLIEE